MRPIVIEFYKENLDFPISGGDSCSFSHGPSVKRVISTLLPYIGKKTNIVLNQKDKRKIFISNFIYFCKLENIDYKNILEIDVTCDADKIIIVVNDGHDENVKTLSI
jgi:hypothetical protein